MEERLAYAEQSLSLKNRSLAAFTSVLKEMIVSGSREHPPSLMEPSSDLESGTLVGCLSRALSQFSLLPDVWGVG